MKLRIFPKKEVVRTMLSVELDRVESDIEKTNAEIARLEGNGDNSPIIHNPYKTSELKSLRLKRDGLASNLTTLVDRINLLKSHSPEEVMVEMEL